MKVICLSALALGLFVEQAAFAQGIRVGTFHRPSIVVAYTRSRLKAETVMKPKLAEMQAAKAANDSKKVDELNQWGRAQQELVHGQLAGERPIDDIVEALKPGFSEIASRAGVVLIAPDVAFAAPGVELVDVTDNVLDWLESDDATRKVVRQLREHPGPVPPLH
ncbi:MAG TPA: hypothetical protein VMV60_08755 [Thermoanaerobaculia bacterium]|nr:hypothetical protein [Thermoanaerobaculia bacterium]